MNLSRFAETIWLPAQLLEWFWKTVNWSIKSPIERNIQSKSITPNWVVLLLYQPWAKRQFSNSITHYISFEKCKNKIADTAKELAEKKATLDEQKVEYQNLDKYYDQFVTWAEEFNNSSISRQRMIVNALIDRIYVFKGYQVIVVIKSTYNPFLALWPNLKGRLVHKKFWEPIIIFLI